MTTLIHLSQPAYALTVSYNFVILQLASLLGYGLPWCGAVASYMVLAGFEWTRNRSFFSRYVEPWNLDQKYSVHLVSESQPNNAWRSAAVTVHKTRSCLLQHHSDGCLLRRILHKVDLRDISAPRCKGKIMPVVKMCVRQDVSNKRNRTYKKDNQAIFGSHKIIFFQLMPVVM